MARVSRRRSGPDGLVEAYIHAGKRLGVLVELDCETDFVARTPELGEIAHEIAMQIAATDPAYVSIEDIPEAELDELRSRLRAEAIQEGIPEELAARTVEGKLGKYAQERVLLEQLSIRDDSKTVGQMVQDLGAKTREAIRIRRFARFQIDHEGDVGSSPANRGDEGDGGDEGLQGAPVPRPDSPPTLSGHEARELSEE